MRVLCLLNVESVWRKATGKCAIFPCPNTEQISHGRYGTHGDATVSPYPWVAFAWHGRRNKDQPSIICESVCWPNSPVGSFHAPVVPHTKSMPWHRAKFPA